MDNKYCCKTLEENKGIYGWFKAEINDKEKYLMPHILGTNIRLNFCPSCGKEIRHITIDSEIFNEKP